MEAEVYNERKNKITKIINSSEYVPMKISELSFFMEVPSNERDEFNYIIKELENDGELIITKKGKIMPLSDMQLVKGIFQGNAKGFGFVMPDETRTRDIFIPEEYVGGAMHKDLVLAQVVSEMGPNTRAEGRIVKVLKRGLNGIVGTFDRNKNFGFVRPDDPKISSDIYIPKSGAKGAVNGHKVVVKITKPASIENRNPEGKIIEILGHINDPGVDILSIVRQFQIPEEFPQEVLREAENISPYVLEEDMKNRLDLRDILTVTIDGEDAKDLDDAVTLAKEGDIFRLGVHIADVTNYVKEGSPLDKEALKRGTSVYLADRVIPMLPHSLSNGICSLNEEEERLALSCIMDIDKSGNVVSHKIEETIINVNKRLSYEGVELALNDDEYYEKEYAEVLPMLRQMGELSEILRQKRIERGAIEFDFQESKVVLDEKGWPIDIVPRKRTFSTGIIEEFMLVCNETIAQTYYWLEMPFVYRSHAKPDKEKLEALSEFISHFGYSLKGRSNHPKSIQALISRLQDKPEIMLISKVALRSMKQARYTYENEGHFGLAANYYCHFTSPIRRYPDLQIHRIIKENIEGRLDEKRQKHYTKILPEVCKNSSLTERTAEEAERETLNLKKAQYMQDKVGQIFDGIVSSVTNWGIYVELSNTVEGMVSFSDMSDDYYIFDEKNYEVVGEHYGNIYKIGQHVKVSVLRADIENRRIDLLFVRDES